VTSRSAFARRLLCLALSETDSVGVLSRASTLPGSVGTEEFGLAMGRNGKAQTFEWTRMS
jgi:hypothetical protein